MTLAEYKTRLGQIVGGGYLFYGEEMYLAERYLELTRRAHFDDGDLAAFNHIRIDGETFSPVLLLETMQSLPVFAERKLIEVSGVNYNTMKDEERHALTEVLSRLPEYEYNTLILIATSEEFDPGTPKKPSALFKLLAPHIEPIHFERQTGARLNKWLSGHFLARGVVASPDVCAFMINHCGTDMRTLSLQAEKIAAYVAAKSRGAVCEEDVRLIGCASEEQDAFALADAVLAGDADRALAELIDRKRRRERPEITLSAVSSVFVTLYRIRVLLSGGMQLSQIAAATGIHAYRVELYAKKLGGRGEESLRAALKCLADADLKMKSTGIDAYLLLERAVMEAMLKC